MAWRRWCHRCCARLRFCRQVNAWHSPRRARFCVLLAPRGQVEAALLGEPLSRHWSERHWRKTGLLMACKRREDATFTWPAIKDGAMALNYAQFEALFAGLD